MKRIEATIPRNKFDQVKRALNERGVRNLTVADVREYGVEQGEKIRYRGAESRTGYFFRLRLEFYVADNQVQKVIDAIRESGQFDRTNEGAIAVVDLAEFVPLWIEESETRSTSDAAFVRRISTPPQPLTPIGEMTTAP